MTRLTISLSYSSKTLLSLEFSQTYKVMNQETKAKIEELLVHLTEEQRKKDIKKLQRTMGRFLIF